MNDLDMLAQKQSLIEIAAKPLPVQKFHRCSSYIAESP